MPVVIGLGDTAWNDPLNIFGGKPPAPEPPKPEAETAKPRFTLTEQDRQDLRKTIAAEAAGEGETGMIAVGNVIRNRAERRGKSLADVVREPNQFTGYEVPGPDALQILQDPDQVAKIDSIIDRMAAGELPDITGGADHYHANYVSPDWAGKMPKTAEVGQHLFYRAENGPDTKRKPMPTYNDLAGQIGLDGDPFEAVLKGETAPASDRKPKGRGIADLLPDDQFEQTQESASVLLSKLQAGKPPEYISNMKPELQSGLVRMFSEAPDFVRDGLDILSGARSPERQAQIIAENAGKYGFDREKWQADVEKLGPVEAGKKWRPFFRDIGLTANIGMPGTSKHQEGVAADLGWKGGKFSQAPKEVRDWVHANASNYNLAFPLGHEPWHIETAGARSGAIEENPTPVSTGQAAIAGQTPSGVGQPRSGNTIVIDEGFAASDPMGLLAGENPFAGIVDQAKAAKAAEQEQVANQFEQNRITGLNQIANRETEARRADLEAQSPGRYVEIDAAELPEFQKKWEEENRSEGVLGDTGRILKSGVIGVGQSLTSLADTIFSNVPGGKEFLKASDDIDRWLLGETLDQRMDTAKARTNASVTPEQAEADFKNWWDSDRGTFGPAWRDPRSYLRTVGESVPATVVTMAPGGMLARGAYLRTLAATGSERAAAAAAARTATVAGALLEGTMGGADTARVVRDRIAAIPRDQLLETDTVKALIEGGMSEDQAIAALTDDASTKAFAIAGVATGMFGGMGDRALAKILAEGVGGGIVQRMLTGAARGMVAEGLLEEAPQGAAQTIAGNIGVRDAKPEQDLTEGMGEAVASGIAAGGVMGGGMGAAGGAASPPSSGAASVDENAAAPPAAAAPTPTAAPEPRGPIGRSVKHAEDQIAQRQAANPAPSPVTSPQPSADGRPAPGATVTVSADGIEPFMGTVQSYEGDEAVVSTADGELFQVPLGTLSVNAPPVQTIPDRGPQPINDTIPEFSTDPALEPLPPAAAEVTSEGLPPRSEQKDATERFPSAPTPGQRVIVDDENGGRFAATVQSYENNSTEALVRTDDGKDLQVPVSSLKVSKLTPKQVEAQDLKRNPPVDREVGDAGPTSRTVLGKTIVLPDDKHARLFDLGKERQAQKRVMGTSALDLDRVDPRELKALAQEFGISEQGVGQLADDYATRMVRNVRSANSKLPQRMPPVMDNILARWRRDAVDAEAATAPAADETQSWWDRELDDEGRRLAMISANIKRPPKMPWADLSPAMQRKLAMVRSEQQAAAAAPADVDSTEANSVESKDQTPTVSVDVAANEAATSPTNDRPEPTPAQKEAGNYKVGRISLGGLDISIENPAGSERKGTDKNGKAWSIQMKSHYGYIRGTVGRDKDHIDVFVKPGTETLDAASPVFIVDQENADGSFDEHKVMLGYGSQDEAEKAYLENYTKGWKIGPVTATPLSGFKDWLKRGYTDEPASIEINEVFWNPPPAEDEGWRPTDEYGDDYLPETKEQIYKDLLTRISVPKFVEQLSTKRDGMGAAVIEPSGKLYLIRPTHNPNGDHAEFFGRMGANELIDHEKGHYARISSYDQYFGYSTGGDISQATAATIKALETAASRAGINVLKPANDYKVVGEAPADEKSQASATPKPKSLTEFLAERGGVQDQGGDLRVAGIRAGKESFVPGAGSLIRANGMTLDQARKLAVEAGYLTDAGATSNRPSESYISDLVDAIVEDVRSGRQLFSKADAAQAARWLEEQQIKQDLDRYGSEEEFRSQQAMEAALDEVTALTGRERTDVFATDIAAVMVQKGVDFDTAAIEVDRRYEEQALAAARDAKPQIVGALGDIPFFDEDGGAASAARTVNDGNVAGRTETPTDAGTVLEGSSRAGSAGSQGERSEAQRGSEGGVSGVPESGRVQENDGRRQQKARQPELAPGRSTTRTVAGKSVVFPDEYHAEIFDLGMNLLKDNGLSPADITAGTSIDEVVPENFRVLGPRREEAQRLASTIGTYMDPTILSADEMGLAAMEIAVMETEVAVSKRSEASIRASSVIDVDAQQEWTQAILDEVRLGTPVPPRSEGEFERSDAPQDGDDDVTAEVPDAEEKAQAEGVVPTAPAAAQKPAGKIDDFGEKIAGARKDMVRDFQNALSADVDFQNEPLSKIFPQPDYEKLAESGVERRVLAVTALIRDEIPAKPRKGYKVDRWAKQVKTLRDFAAGLMSGRLSEEEFRKRLLDAPTLSNLANTADLIADLPLSKLSEAAKWRVRSGNYTIFEGVKLEGSTRLLTLSDADGRMVRDKDGRVISAKTFEELKAAALPIMRAALSDDTPAPKKRTPVAVYSDRTTKAIFIGFKGQSGVIRLKSGFASVKDARAYISENADDIQNMIDEMRAGFTMRREVNRPREGEARRDGDVTPEQFQEAFGFRGVQFGNYVEDARRQFELNEAFDGLMDLAEVLGLPPRALSLNGTLGLAFGARGRGGANAAKAHFEADQIAINLTKAKGAGSLAHEWFHGLDNYFGRMDTSGNMAAMISKDKARGGGTRDEIWRAWKAVADSLDQGSYAKRMRKADEARSTPYWNTTVEKVARGFEKYVVDRLADKRASNDYLANIDENAGAYPTDQEMAEQGVTAAFDKLFSTIETKVEDSGNVKMFEGRSDGEPLALQPRMDKLADPEAIIPSDPAFRRIPVPSRPAYAAPFTWARDLLLDRGRKNGNEFLIAIDDDGTVVDFGTSDHAKFVGLNARLSKAVANPDRRLVLMHNHPSNWPLSLADLSMLLHPGVFSVWAFGHGGVETRAALTARGKAALALGTTAADIAASIDRFEKAMRDVERSIETVLIGNLDKREIDVSQAEIAHFMAIPEIARRAGVIEFTVNQPYDHAKIPMLDRAIDNAALKLARTLLDERATPQTSDARVLRQAVSVQHIAELGGLAENRSDVEGRNEGQSGLREGSARDYQAEAQGRNARRLTGSRRISENSIVEAISGKWTDLNPSLLATVPLNYFVELARPNMTAVKEYMSVKRLMDAYRGDKHAKADAIAGEWLKYMRLGFGQSNKAKAQELADLMHESTLAGIDPSQTDEETRAKAGYDILRKRYQALPAKGKELFAKVRDAYRAQADELDQILLDNVRKSQKIAKDQAEARYRKKLEEIRADRSMNPLDRRKAEEDAASRYKAESTKMDWSAKARLTKLRIQFESNRVPAPYFPLGRFGQYFVTAKDVDGSVISFSKFERAADRDRFARDIQRDYPGATVTKGVMKDMTDPRAAMDPRMVAEIEQLLGNAGVDQDLMDMVYQRYLETLPELSMRKRYMHRKGTAGYDTDALRVFSSHMFHAAHQMAKLKYGLELQELVNTTFDQAEAADDQTRAMRLANEMASRHKWVMNPTGGSLAQTMTSTAFVWFLAASPAAAVLNLTQTFMMGLPILGARFGGITRAGVEVAKASADLISGKGSVRNANLSREEMAAVDAFYRSGMIDRTQSHDLAGVGDTGVRYSPLRARVMGVMSWAFHNTEVWNREATALAAYRLARKAGQSHLAAIDSAHDLTWKTHFDYANSSRPRIMQNDFAKVALVFRSYSINMLYRLFRDIHQSVKGESAQARREARYQLAGVTGMMALMSGVTGVFGFNMFMAIAGMVFGDDDDPMDFDERFKADVLEILGPELGGVVLKGVPGHYLGVDLTSRIGMPDLWFRSPGQDLQGKEEWNYWLSQTLGATAGIGEQWFRGASLIMEGDVARGVEVMAPKFIRDPMKAFRYANEGLQSIKGDELLSADQIGIHGAVAQAMGVSPAIVSETWDRSGALKNAERRVMDERQRVVNAWAMAALAGDKEGVAEAIERVKAFNKKPIHSAIPITQDTLKRSIKTRVRNAAKREDGVLIQNEILSQRLRAAMPERLY